jgi:hypothetical protein
MIRAGCPNKFARLGTRICLIVFVVESPSSVDSVVVLIFQARPADVLGRGRCHARRMHGQIERRPACQRRRLAAASHEDAATSPQLRLIALVVAAVGVGKSALRAR